MISIGESSHDSIKLLVISEVVKFKTTQLLTKISKWSLGLGKVCPSANRMSITSNFNKEFRVEKSQIGVEHSFSLIALKAL